jgi:hypothetical protein
MYIVLQSEPIIVPFYILFSGAADLDPSCILFYKVNCILLNIVYGVADLDHLCILYRANPLLYRCPSMYCLSSVADLFHLVMIFVYPVLKLIREMWNCGKSDFFFSYCANVWSPRSAGIQSPGPTKTGWSKQHQWQHLKFLVSSGFMFNPTGWAPSR